MSYAVKEIFYTLMVREHRPAGPPCSAAFPVAIYGLGGRLTGLPRLPLLRHGFCRPMAPAAAGLPMQRLLHPRLQPSGLPAPAGVPMSYAPAASRCFNSIFR